MKAMGEIKSNSDTLFHKQVLSEAATAVHVPTLRSAALSFWRPWHSYSGSTRVMAFQKTHAPTPMVGPFRILQGYLGILAVILPGWRHIHVHLNPAWLFTCLSRCILFNRQPYQQLNRNKKNHESKLLEITREKYKLPCLEFLNTLK